MRSAFQTETVEQMLSSIFALFCYSASLGSLFALGYSLISLGLSAAGQQLIAIHSPHGM